MSDNIKLIMRGLKYTLIGDGSSDKALMQIINWLLNDLFPTVPVQGKFADFRNLSNPPAKGNIAEQVKYASLYYEYDILFYHRDAENNSSNIIENRKKEILSVLASSITPKVICIVPIVMMESWLLINPDAIRKAAGNRNYNGEMNLPPINKLESTKDSKELLHYLLREASGRKKRNLKNFNVNNAVHFVAEYIVDFSPLRELSSFNSFEKDLKEKVRYFLNELKY